MTDFSIFLYRTSFHEADFRIKIGSIADSLNIIEVAEGKLDHQHILPADILIIEWASLNKKKIKNNLENLPPQTIFLYSDIAELQPALQDILATGTTYIEWPKQHALLLDLLTKRINSSRQKNIAKNEFALQSLMGFGDTFIQVDRKGLVKTILQTGNPLTEKHTKQYIDNPWYRAIDINTTLSSSEVLQFISAALRTQAVTRLHPFALNTPNGGCYLVDGLVSPVSFADGTHGSTLTIRQLARLDTLLSNSQMKLSADTSINAILVLSPDNLHNINGRFGRDCGDLLLKQVSLTLRHIVPSTELANHFGGATFMVLFKHSSIAQIENIARYLFKALGEITLDSVDLKPSFSLGLALNVVTAPRTLLDLFHHACHAMVVAQRLGGNQLSTANTESTLQQVGDLDKLSGNLSLNATNDYLSLIMSYSILSDDLDKLQGKAFLNALLRQLVAGLTLSSASFAKVKSGVITSPCTFYSGGQNCEELPIQLSVSQQAVIDGKHASSDQFRVFTSINAKQDHDILLPIREGQSVIGLLLLKVTDQYAIRVKNHLLLENICEYVRIKQQQNNQWSAAAQPANTQPELGNMLFQSASMQSLVEMIKTVAPTEATVLITGESGTGKELLAQSLHKMSKRAKQPFVVFDCGAVVENLLDSELFGHVKGAFTGALNAKQGAIAKAEGGTLFLDEVGELPIDTQAKLLRFVQDRQYSLVGQRDLKNADVRIVAATNVDLEQNMQEGKFRQDLYYRLNVINLVSLPLRERPEDILPIADFYLGSYCTQYQKSITGFSQKAQRGLLEYSWRGNVRELVNLVHRAVVICQHNEIDAHDLGLYPGLTNGEPNLMLTKNDDVVASRAQPILDIAHAQIKKPLESTHKVVSNTDLWTDYISYFKNNDIASNPIELLEAKLFEDALERAQNVTLQAAGYLGIAETTFRRRWPNLSVCIELPDQGLLLHLDKLVIEIQGFGRMVNRLLMVRSKLVNAIDQLNIPVSRGAHILGMSPPTYRKILNSPHN